MTFSLLSDFIRGVCGFRVFQPERQVQDWRVPHPAHRVQDDEHAVPETPESVQGGGQHPQVHQKRLPPVHEGRHQRRRRQASPRETHLSLQVHS